MSQELETQTLDSNLNNGGVQEDLPKATSALTCGIIALPFSLGIIGIILSIVAITQGNHSIRQYHGSPGKYTEKSFKRAKAGRTCGIISLSLFGASILIIFLIIAIGI
ncbi:MAG: hypothetical protein ACFHU9_02985 [Fluviicola sp.]